MSPALPSRRRADRFQQLVDGATTHVSSRDLDELLDLVRQLRALPEVAPRPEFSANLRTLLMAEADVALAPMDPVEERLRVPPRKQARDRRVATVLGGAAILGATTSMAVAAQSALPGDSLYTIKRAIEDAQAGLATDEASRGATLLDNATGRLDEVAALAVRGTDEGISEVPATLTEFTEQSEEASQVLLDSYEQDGDRSSIRELRNFTRDSMDRLLALEVQLPSDAHDELVDAARALTAIDDRAEALCPSCGGAGINEIPRLLLSVATTTDVASVTVPAAEPSRQPAKAPAEQEAPVPAEDTQVTLPDVDLDDGTSATGDSGTSSGGGATNDATDGATQDPVTELTHTLTAKGDGKSTDTKVDADNPLDDVLTGAQDTSDNLLD